MKIIDYLIGLFLVFMLWIVSYRLAESVSIAEDETKNDTIVIDSLCMEDSFSIKDFVLELHIQEVQYPDIILRQACLESSWFTSYVWKTKNNPFGFRNKDGYIMFNDWRSAIDYMKCWQDKYYKGGEYYRFLEDRKYSEDSCYVETLKKMDMNNLKYVK